MNMGCITDASRRTIEACLHAATDGEFFPDWELETLFGVSRNQVRSVRNAWPDVDLGNDVVAAAVLGALNNLLGYPHGHQKQLEMYHIDVPERLLDALDEVKKHLGD